jgi:hypothetical protein
MGSTLVDRPIRLVFTDDAGKTDEDTGRFLVDLVVVVHLDKLLS